jgi:hypothetical protein
MSATNLEEAATVASEYINSVYLSEREAIRDF